LPRTLRCGADGVRLKEVAVELRDDQPGHAARPRPEPLPPFAAAPVAVVAATAALVVALLSGRYGFHRDELYFLQAGERPAWGYVDQPPLTPLLARLAVELFGSTPAGLRVAATLAFIATVVMMALLARELGAARTGQMLAAVGTAIAGYVLAMGHMVSTGTFDVPLWLVVSWLVLRLLRTGDGRWWLAIGAASGVALLNKYLIVLLLAALLAGVLIVGPRAVLRSGWLPAGAALALLVAAPNVWWQAAHGWPQLTVAGGISAEDGAMNRLLFLPEQLYLLSPVLVPVWLAGLWRLWQTPALSWARAVVPAYVLLCAAVIALGGKGYYAAPLLLVLVAAGSHPAAVWLARGRAAVRRTLAAAVVAVAASVSAVISLPVLPAPLLAVVNTVNPEQGEQVGWPEFVAAVSQGWEEIPEHQRESAVIFTTNYGQAGAVAQYGPDYGLPEAYSGHMSHADWGPPPDTADGPVVLVSSGPSPELERLFGGCRAVAHVDNGVGLDNEEQGARVALCDGPTEPWSRLWDRLRHYY
jgi:4-amino-4-deoxy-L-arabinose transferase-like glycosyltransferase